MANSQLTHSSARSDKQIPMLERIDGLLGLGEKQVAFRVNWKWHGREEFAAGDVLIVDESLAAYSGDIVINNEPCGASAHNYSGDVYRNYDGVLVEVRKPTMAVTRLAERKAFPPIRSLAQLVERIASQVPRPYEGYGVNRITSPDLLATRGIRAHQLTIAGGMGDVYFPGTLFVKNLLVETGTNLIVSRDLESMDEIMVHGSLTVGGHITCDDRLHVRGDLYARHYVHCGRLLVGGDAYCGLGIDAKEAAAVGGSIRIEDSIRCTDLYVAGNVRSGIWVDNATIEGDVTSCYWIHVASDLVVDGNIRCDDNIEAGGSITAKGTIWTRRTIKSGENCTISCFKRMRGTVKSGHLKENEVIPSRIKGPRKLQALHPSVLLKSSDVSTEYATIH